MSRSSTNSSWQVPAVTGRSAAPLREKVAAVLRRAILSLDLVAGERLVERELIERLGVSRTTVREAFRELETEGLLEVIPQRGAVVATVSEADAADLYEARVAIEALVVRRFVERASDQDVRDLVDAIEHFAAVAVDDGDIKEMLAAKDAFYEVLAHGASSPALWQLLSGLQGRVRVLRARSLSRPGRPPISAQELRDLGGAIVARDGDGAAAACAGHVHAAASAGLTALAVAQTGASRPQ